MAIFEWKHRELCKNKIGDRRKVYRWVLLPECLLGEWRWLGREYIEQEYASWREFDACNMSMKRCVGWRDIAWVPRLSKGRS